MAHRTLDRTLLVTSACAVLLSMAPAMAGAWMERLSGTMGASRPDPPTVILEIPRERGGSAEQGAQSSSMLLFLSGVIVSILLGLLLGSRVLQGWQGRQRRQRDIDRLTEEFQALFRKIDQGG